MKIEQTNFKGLNALKISKPGIEMAVVTQMGPRISSLKPEADGSNMLAWDDSGFVSDRRRGAWILMGGQRVWVWEFGSDECEETYAPDYGACHVSTCPPSGSEFSSVTITGVEDPNFRTRRFMRIEDKGMECCIDVVSGATNTSDKMLWSGGIWALACTNPTGCTYFAPIPTEKPKSGWSGFNMRHFPHWAGHTSPFPNPQLGFTDRFFVIRPQAIETKVAIEVPMGWIGCAGPNANFYKLFCYDPASIDHYPYGCGCNVAFYVSPDNFMVEMETMGPWRTLRPGESLEHRERWVVMPPCEPDKIDFGQIETFRKGM